MGVLTEGKTYTWKEQKDNGAIEYVKKAAVDQLIRNFEVNLKSNRQAMVWGDELEFMLVELNEEEKTVRLKLRAGDLLKALSKKEKEFLNGTSDEKPETSWKPEYGRYMIEVTPFSPYHENLDNILLVEENMGKRRAEANELLEKNEHLVAYSAFPLMGALKHFTIPKAEAGGEFANSRFLPDELINQHIRFGTLTRNIRMRKGSNVCICAPLFMDENTDPTIGLRVPWTGELIKGIPQYSVTPTYCCKFLELQKPTIFMDAMGFGMGNCCLQCTYQTTDIKQARHLYDQLVPWAPMLLSLTCATPILRGLLSGTDARWYVITASVDDRTPEEQTTILKSRYDSVSLYIAKDNFKYNKLSRVKINQDAYKKLIESPSFDESLATHFSHLMIRDPLVIFSDYDKIDNCQATDHFENLQSTNWQSIRFKPPPTPYNFENQGRKESKIGWRVEFRVMEIQFTDFENAAFSQFMWLWAKMLIELKYTFVIPISKVDKNMCIAHFADSARNGKFFVRTNYQYEQKNEEPKMVQLNINQIINGCEAFKGMIPLMREYLSKQKITQEVSQKYDHYLSFIGDRAAGKLMTPAHFIRKFVMEHPDYKKDSVVSESIAYDLTKLIVDIGEGRKTPAEVYGTYLKPKI